MSEFITFGNHYGSAMWQIRGFTILIIAVALISLPIYGLRIFKDIKAIRNPSISRHEKTDLSDRLFGWSLAIFIIIIEFAMGISKLL